MKNLNSFINSYIDSSEIESADVTLESYREGLRLEVAEISYTDLSKWAENTQSQDLGHETGLFFTIRGAVAKCLATGEKKYQPVIDQPEQGILGLLFSEEESLLKVLLQAKIEPGNLDTVQYSPTVQATKSNYSGAHNGRKVFMLDYFVEGSENVFFRQLQSEHGYKFFRKANDNVVSFVGQVSVVEHNPNFRWIN